MREQIPLARPLEKFNSGIVLLFGGVMPADDPEPDRQKTCLFL